MSHQTGINVDDDLQEAFVKCRDGCYRLMKISIKNEQLVLDEFTEPAGSWEDDYDRMLLPCVEERQPCYLLYRLDSKHEGSYRWLFISWSPDFSPVREKMLYASTKATLKKEFGNGQINDELFGTIKEDINLSALKKHRLSEVAPAPLTEREEELKNIRRVVSGADISIDAKHQTIQGIAFPISDDAINSIFEMRDGNLNYVQLSIDLTNEFVNLETNIDTSIEELASRVPTDHARYHLFVFPHNFEGDHICSVVFIYSNPGYKSTIKERMLYSSCKNPVVDVIENKIGIVLAKKIEIDDPKELTKQFMMEEIHPKENVHKQKFLKPKGPPNRGARRITKMSTNNETNS
ncbi:TWF1 (predicted) [Pycnogonum litorale]